MSSKAKVIETAGQNIYIPTDCKERFLASPHVESYFQTHHIRWAGCSNLTTGYKASRWKNMETHLILYTLSGTGHLKIKGQPACRLCKGDTFIAPNNSEYSYRAEGPWNIMWFHPDANSKWDKLIGTRPRVRKAMWMDELNREMEACFGEINRRRADSKSALHSYANLIVLYLMREFEKENTAGTKSFQILENVWKEVQQHIDRKWNVEELAKLANMSVAGFQRTVKEHTGQSAMQIVTIMRMENASAMLLYTDYTLDTIAKDIGYESQFAFSRAFKRYSGISPNQFKAKNQSRKAS